MERMGIEPQGWEDIDRWRDRDHIFPKIKNEPNPFLINKIEFNKQEEFKNKFILDKFLDIEIDKKLKIMQDRDVRRGDIIGIRAEFLNDENKLPGPRLRQRELELPSPTVGGLAGLLKDFPQVDPKSGIRYLLTSGLAVEVITGFVRNHHDTDLVICDTSSAWWMKLITDNVTHKKYWADMSFDDGYLEKTAWEAKFMSGGTEHIVLTVHPAIILIQKLSNAWGRPPREKDLADVRALIAFWRTKLGEDKSWLAIMDKAVAALPNEKERERTFERLTQFLKV